MISKNKLKQLASYKQAKYRDEDNVFVVEGIKMLEELLESNFEIVFICATKEWLCENQREVSERVNEVCEVTEGDLKKISFLMAPNQVYAVVKRKEPLEIELKDKLVLVLDDIKDPGNLGTIIRIADWFGIENIVCSNETVDVYNPKTVQSTMGSIFRVNVLYENIEKFILDAPTDYPVYGTIVDGGDSIYSKELTKEGFIIIGSESHGISKGIIPLVKTPITIPNFSKEGVVESLNAGIATGIICSEFRRNQ